MGALAGLPLDGVAAMKCRSGKAPPRKHGPERVHTLLAPSSCHTINLQCAEPESAECGLRRLK